MQPRARLTRERLLKAAAEAFAANGYAATSLTEIHERAGVTKGAVYFHYPSKESVAAAVVELQVARLRPVVDGCAARGADPFVTVVALTFAAARAFRDEAVVRAGTRLRLERHLIPVRLPPPYEEWQETVAGVLERAERAGSLAEKMTAERAARVVVSAFSGVQHLCDSLADHAGIEERLRDLWTVLLPGIQRDPDPGGTLGKALTLCQAD